MLFRCSTEGCGTWNRHLSGRSNPVCGRCRAPLDTSGAPREVNDAELARLVAGPLPVVVDFWAPWCGPCRAMAPHLDRAARAMAGRVLTLKVNTEQHQQTASALGIQAIPTLVTYREGRVVHQQAGLVTGSALDAIYQRSLT